MKDSKKKLTIHKKWAYKILFLLMIISIIIIGNSYNKRVQEENLLSQKLESLHNDFDKVKILSMNEDEESLYNDLISKFENSLSERKIEESQTIYDEMLKLKKSVDNRIKEEERIAAEEEEKKRAEEEEEKRKAEEERKIQEEKKAEELALQEEKEKAKNSETKNTVQASNDIEKPVARIGNTSPAANSNQLISVVSTGGSTAELVLWQKDSQGVWYEYDSMFARLGENGMKYASEVYEMDLCTPTGVYTLTEAFGVLQNPGTKLPYRVLDGSEYWVDDVDSEYYNTMQFGEPNGRWKSAEHLTDYQNAYKYVLVIDYNRWPVVPGKSSAIFLHVDVGIPTWGCVAVAENKMIEILNWLNPSSNPKIMLAMNYEELYNY